jgi:hypothetical protein
MNFMLWFLLNVLGAVFLGLYFFDSEIGIWSLYLGISFVIIFLIRWMINSIATAATYNTYKKFQSHLGFQLSGWEKLGSYPNQLNTLCWSYKSSIEVILKADVKNEFIKLIDDSLYLFTVDADKEFYEAEIGGDGRMKWVRAENHKVQGSSNDRVIGKMYILLTVYLKSIQEKYGPIEEVKITFDSNIFEVNPPPSSD